MLLDAVPLPDFTGHPQDPARNLDPAHGGIWWWSATPEQVAERVLAVEGWRLDNSLAYDEGNGLIHYYQSAPDAAGRYSILWFDFLNGFLSKRYFGFPHPATHLDGGAAWAAEQVAHAESLARWDAYLAALPELDLLTHGQVVSEAHQPERRENDGGARTVHDTNQLARIDVYNPVGGTFYDVTLWLPLGLRTDATVCPE